jgi:sortase A
LIKDSKIGRVVERTLLVLGLLLLGMFVLAHVYQFVIVRVEMAKFEAKRQSTETPRADSSRGPVVDHWQTRSIGTALWSIQRVKTYEATLRKPVEPLAILRVSRLNLEAPVLEGADEFTLDRGVGLIRNTSLPGQGGNIGIAGHRDSFFRSLKDIKTGDTIDLVTIAGTDVYVVNRIRITDPTDVSVLRPREKPSLTLVTCYPFYFVGPAPSRYIVEASLKE